MEMTSLFDTFIFYSHSFHLEAIFSYVCVTYFNSSVSLSRTEGKDGIKNKGVMCDHMQSIFNHLSF